MVNFNNPIYDAMVKTGLDKSMYEKYGALYYNEVQGTGFSLEAVHPEKYAAEIFSKRVDGNYLTENPQNIVYACVDADARKKLFETCGLDMSQANTPEEALMYLAKIDRFDMFKLNQVRGFCESHFDRDGNYTGERPQVEETKVNVPEKLDKLLSRLGLENKDEIAQQLVGKYGEDAYKVALSAAVVPAAVKDEVGLSSKVSTKKILEELATSADVDKVKGFVADHFNGNSLKTQDFEKYAPKKEEDVKVEEKVEEQPAVVIEDVKVQEDKKEEVVAEDDNKQEAPEPKPEEKKDDKKDAAEEQVEQIPQTELDAKKRSIDDPEAYAKNHNCEYDEERSKKASEVLGREVVVLKTKEDKLLVVAKDDDLVTSLLKPKRFDRALTAMELAKQQGEEYDTSVKQNSFIHKLGRSLGIRSKKENTNITVDVLRKMQQTR